MKIEKMETGLILFEQLIIGDCFNFNNKYYIKTENCKLGNLTLDFNAVNLKNGRFIAFENNVNVKKIDAVISVDK